MTALSTAPSTLPVLSGTPAAATNTPQPDTAAVQFLGAIFEPGDYILLRPIESWTESGKKQSKVDYKGIAYRLVGTKDQAGQWQRLPHTLSLAVASQKDRSEQTKCNVFFGICPRHGTQGQYDQAWQIRTVRVLWADVDDGTPEEAIERCKAAGLPEPSIVVASGRGAHLYWILDEPIIIDDGDPRPVFTEFIDQGEERKRSRRKFIKDEERREGLY